MQSEEQETSGESGSGQHVSAGGNLSHVALCSTDCQIHRKLHLSYLQAVET